jgi:hypothetical protein
MFGASSFQVLERLESLRALDVFFFGTAISDTPPDFFAHHALFIFFITK